MAAEQAPPTNTNVTGEAPAAAEVLALPSQWPGAFKAYKYSKQAVKLNVNAIVGWLVVGGVVSGILSLIGNAGGNNGVKGLLEIISFLVAPLFSVIVTKALIAGVRRQPVSFNEALPLGKPYWLNAIVLSILVGVSLTISFLLLIVPFFFVWPRLALANYFLVDKNLDAVDAYKASWNATKGRVGAMYGILGAQIAMALLVVTIIGIPFAIYFLIMFSAAHAVLYELIIKSPAPATTAAVEA